MKTWWKTKAWPWLKENWWLVLLLPVGILVAISKVLRPRMEAVPSELIGASETEREADQLADAKKQYADKMLAERVDAIKQDHEETVRVLTEEQSAQVKTLMNDPEALNSYLLEVGQRARSKPQG